MDPHPTPFPGKRRPAAFPVRKKEISRSAFALPSESKPKRRFGTAICSNIDRTTQKPTTAKPWKPSGTSIATQKQPDRASRFSTLSSGRTADSKKKTQHVGFQEQPLTTAVDSSCDAVQDVLLCTPDYSSIKKPLVQETPYQSAEICSNCRLHRLETSSYWLEQIKLAESAGKHFISAAFFRLALECKSQPFVVLQKELKFYIVRHEVVSLKDLWSELLQAYELTSNELDAYLIEADDSNYKNKAFDPDDRKEAFFPSEASEKPQDLLGASAPHIGCSDETSGTESTEDLETECPNSIGKDYVQKTGEVSHKESEFFDLKFDGSSSDTGPVNPCLSAKKADQEGSKVSDYKVQGWKQGEGMRVLRDRLRNKAKAGKQCSHKPLIDGNEKHEECVEEEIKNKNQE
ncbi:hypothetical protein HPP92_002841 [Vanilla planifolia]|uniref:Uncharacterized protein n=1 Tax=Vanilla planifolia TaxID=51239 RepID=A0A835S722_VANPL|nr:hypothetical protein HPP92_002841 [Vanilla planifolia]